MAVLDADRVISGSDDNTVRVWHVRTGECEHVLKGHTDVSEIISFSDVSEIISFSCSISYSCDRR